MTTVVSWHKTSNISTVKTSHSKLFGNSDAGDQQQSAVWILRLGTISLQYDWIFCRKLNIVIFLYFFPIATSKKIVVSSRKGFFISFIYVRSKLGKLRSFCSSPSTLNDAVQIYRLAWQKTSDFDATRVVSLRWTRKSRCEWVQLATCSAILTTQKV